MLNAKFHYMKSWFCCLQSKSEHVRGCGNPATCSEWYKILDPNVKRKVQNAGFGEFLKLIPKGNRDRCLVHALGERWWDTTNSFFFDHVGEMTMTPLDFSALTGIRVSGKPIKYDMEAHTNSDELVRLYGTPIAKLVAKKVEVSDMYDAYKDFVPKSWKEVNQLTRVFILSVVGSTLCNDKTSSVYFYYTPSLRKVRKIGEYNWGAAALACMYRNMNAICRGKNTTVSGFWRAWEVNKFDPFLYLSSLYAILFLFKFIYTFI